MLGWYNWGLGITYCNGGYGGGIDGEGSRDDGLGGDEMGWGREA